MTERSRQSLPYESFSNRYKVGKRTFKDQQYFQIYIKRLEALRGSLMEAVQKKWESDPEFNATKCDKILELGSSEAEKSYVVVGVLYKSMPLKPNILKDLAQDSGLLLPPKESYTSPEDTILLEDESGRVDLDLNEVDKYCSGTIVAVHGTLKENGALLVDRILLPGLFPTQTSYVPPENDLFICFVSGLGIGAERKNPMTVQLLTEYIQGHLGENTEPIARIIVCGNSVVEKEEEDDDVIYNAKAAREKAKRDALPLKECDLLLSKIASSVPVTLMPGPTDPSTAALPQLPLHPALLPGTYTHENVDFTTNPASFSVGNLSLLGNSGQSVSDIARYTNGLSSLQILEYIVMARHLAPTAPDTQNCYPFPDSDPFVIERPYHVIFTGNQPEYSTKILRDNGSDVRLLCVPSFTDTSTIVMMNLRSLECHPIIFEENI